VADVSVKRARDWLWGMTSFIPSLVVILDVYSISSEDRISCSLDLRDVTLFSIRTTFYRIAGMH
jgi:hypothetical protein